MAGPPRVPIRLPTDEDTTDADHPQEDELRAVGYVLYGELVSNAELRERILRVRRRVRGARSPDFVCHATDQSSLLVQPEVAVHAERDPTQIACEVASKFCRLREPINRRARTKAARNAHLEVLGFGQQMMVIKGFVNMISTGQMSLMKGIMAESIGLADGQRACSFHLGYRADIVACEMLFLMLTIDVDHSYAYIEVRHEPLRWRAIVPDMSREERMAFSRFVGGKKK